MKKSTQSSRYCQGGKPCSQRFNKGAATLFLTILLTFFNSFYGGAALAADPVPGYDPTKVPSNAYSFDLEGCNLDKATEGTYNPAGDVWICDTAASWPAAGQQDSYTDGNLGKEWNELDEVPHRIGTDSSGAAGTETFQFIVGGDSLINAATTPDTVGYDRISLFTKNAALSSGSAANCAYSLKGPAVNIGNFGLGGSATQVVQVVEVTQEQNTVCVFDYTMRLAIGSSLVSGSSNRAFIVAGSGEQSVPIPSDIQPQTLSKTLSAVQESTVAWSILKDADPVTLDFGDTCKVATPLEKDAKITITFTKDSVNPSALNATSTITAGNPSSRNVVYEITDELWGQSPCGNDETLLDSEDKTETVTPGDHNIVIQHDGLPASACHLRNHATAIIKVEDLVNPGQFITVGTLEANFSLPDDSIAQGTVVNQLVKIKDTETISGDGYDFKAVQDVTGVTGAFVSYTAGDWTTGPVVWLSDQQSDSGAIEFTKTVRVTPYMHPHGTLSDTAELLSVATSQALGSFDASVNLSTNPLAELTITKTIPPNIANSLKSGEKIVVSFDVTRDGIPSPGKVSQFTLEFGPGETTKSKLLEDLTPDIYHVMETSDLFDDGINPPVDSPLIPTSPNPQTADLSATSVATCANTLNFTNGLPTDQPVKVTVQKITVPELNSEDPDYLWQFTLACSGFPSETISTVGAGAGPVEFGTFLDASTSCTVMETPKNGWDLTSATPNDGVDTKVCSFSVNIFTDAGTTKSCAFTNVKRGTAQVLKTQSGDLPLSQTFDFEIRKDATLASVGTTLATGSTDLISGVANFTCYAGVDTAICTDVGGIAKLVPGDYQFCEVNMLPGWSNDLAGFVPGGVDNSAECMNFTLVAGETEVFNINNLPPPGGAARTIGFWRNWTSCDGHGNQDPVLDETLALFPIASGQATHGVFIGDLYVDTCVEGVAIVSKHSLDGINRANDAAYGLAAQLLAAKLNYQAGAGQCTAATNAINGGQALLDGINFLAMGDYLPPTVKTPALKAKRNAALNYANTLDKYNNNTLCP